MLSDLDLCLRFSVCLFLASEGQTCLTPNVAKTGNIQTSGTVRHESQQYLFNPAVLSTCTNPIKNTSHRNVVRYTGLYLFIRKTKHDRNPAFLRILHACAVLELTCSFGKTIWSFTARHECGMAWSSILLIKHSELITRLVNIRLRFVRCLPACRCIAAALLIRKLNNVACDYCLQYQSLEVYQSCA